MAGIGASEIQILVSTMNRRTAAEVDLGAAPGTPVLVINQCTAFAPPSEERIASTRMISFAERGLSRSRNRALDAAEADVCLVADDDLRLLPSAVATVRRAFSEHPDAAAISFQIQRSAGVPFRSYGEKRHQHDRRTIGSVRSIELAVRRSRLGELRFDERFGLGARWPAGEENIFLADLLRAGLRAYYVPEPIVLHDHASSGEAAWTPATAQLKGAVVRRMYGSFWPLGAAGLSLQNRARIRALGWRAWLGGFAAGVRAAGDAR